MLAALIACVCVVAIAGCGSSGQKPSASAHAQPLLALSECMRSHGVPKFPDPSATGINIAATGINPHSPSYHEAQAACNKLEPGAQPASQQASEQQKEQQVAISECMRSHGVTGFPDPTPTRPTDPQDYSSIGEGVASHLFTLVPKTINVDSPAFEQAAKACHFQ